LANFHPQKETLIQNQQFFGQFFDVAKVAIIQEKEKEREAIYQM